MKRVLPLSRRRIYSAAIGAALLSQLSAGAGAETALPAEGAKPIKIGFITSLTGVAAESSRQMLQGMQLYLEKVNNKMGGRLVELIVENDESNPATARAKLKKLVEQDHVHLIDGVLANHIAYALAPDVDKYEIPAVFAVTGADDLTQRKRAAWVTRASWTASQGTMPLGEWAVKKLGYKKVAIVALDYAFGWETAGGFQKTFEDAGGQVTQKIWAPMGFTDFTPFIKQIRPDVDAVYFSTAFAAAPIMAKQYFEHGPKKPLIGSGVSFDEGVLSHVGDPCIGVVSTLVYSAALDTPENKNFVRDYRAKFKQDPTQLSEFCYSSGMWIDRAVQSVKGDVENKDKLLAALRKVRLPDAPRGPITVDTYGNPVENVYLRKVEKVNGQLQNTVIHTFPKVSQFWKYKPEEYLKQPVYSKDFPACKYCK